MSVPRTDREISAVYERHWQTVWRVCYAFMKNRADTEDAVQETFLRLIKSAPDLAGEAHEKAWLIRTAANICKNMLRHWWRKREDIDEHEELAAPDSGLTDETLQAVLALPDKYKTVVYLYYYEGYSGQEIADILQRPASTIRNQLRDARGILKERLGDDPDEEYPHR